ncbi:MAG TPA: TetR/AcrR family transcriptional regulator [Iamia sp.]
MPARTTREPQQARAVATRGRIIDAAAAILTERGYAAVTTKAVCARAGVSRGAHLHHFPTRADLLAGAVGHLLELRRQELTARLADLEVGTSIEQMLAVIWPAFEDATFVAWAELCMAARTEPDLAARLMEVDVRFTEATRADFVELLDDRVPDDPAVAELVRDLLFAALVGLGFERLLPRPRRDVQDYFSLLGRLADAALRETPEAGS